VASFRGSVVFIEGGRGNRIAGGRHPRGFKPGKSLSLGRERNEKFRPPAQRTGGWVREPDKEGDENPSW